MNSTTTAPAPVPAAEQGHAPAAVTLPLLLGVLGVVYGDIGTSPLYAFKASLDLFPAAAGMTETTVLGVLSLIFWSLVLIVTVKYVPVVMRADNRGEGGILALMALAQRVCRRPAGARARCRAGRHRRRLPVLRRRRDHAGDLGALGGRGAGGHLAPVCRPFVLPISAVVIVLLFAFQ